MASKYKSKNHSKFLLQFHLILVCKYRKKLLVGQISEDIKRLSKEILERHNCVIKYVETDQDHIHYLIETVPNLNLSNMVRILKQYTTYHIWQLYDFSKHFWKEHTFWTDRYFICSIGNVSEKILKEYIEGQG